MVFGRFGMIYPDFIITSSDSEAWHENQLLPRHFLVLRPVMVGLWSFEGPWKQRL